MDEQAGAFLSGRQGPAQSRGGTTLCFFLSGILPFFALINNSPLNELLIGGNQSQKLISNIFWAFGSGSCSTGTNRVPECPSKPKVVDV